MNTESMRLTSVRSTPVAIGAFSDVESVVSLNNKRSDADSAVAENQQPASVHPEFAFSDGNIEIQTMDQTFWVHEYHLNKFAAFATLIQAAKSSVSDPGRRVVVACDDKTKAEDIYNTLKVVYASHIDGIPDFDSSTMASTLRIASTFDYPALKKFAMSKLEGMSLPAIERIQFSDEFSLPAWEIPAFTELCSRAEPISQAEAEILGMRRFVEIARIRETERTRLAAKFAGGIYEELLQASELVGSLESENSGNSDSARVFEYCSGCPKVVTCDCRIPRGHQGGCSWKVDRCNLHQVAPQALEEGQTKKRDELLKLLGNIRSAVDRPLERESSPSKLLGGPDLKTELSRASWIRRECAVGA